MYRWILFAALAAYASAAQIRNNNGQTIVCYLGSWAVYRPGDGKFEIEQIPPKLCTHFIYSFIGITEQGKVKVLDEWQELPDNWGKDGFRRFTAIRKKNPDAKMLIAIGGWNEGSSKYSKVAADPELRKIFIQDIIEFMKKFGFDGLDVDWEYPAQRGGRPEDKRNFSILLKELRAEFDKHGYLLTAAVAAGESSVSQSYEIPEVCDKLDFVNVMAYDFHGSWERQTGHHALLYYTGQSGTNPKLNVNASINYWISNGCPPEKLVLGIPFYGRSFTLANNNQNELGAPSTGPGTAGPFTREGGMLGYNEICISLKQPGWTVVRDEEDYTPYAYKDNQWVGYDDYTSLTAKTDYIKELGLKGAMIWSIETDDFRGLCKEKYELLKILNKELRGEIPSDPVDTPSEPNEGPIEQPDEQPPAAPAPPSGLCEKEGFLRDEQDCTVFYRCVNFNGKYEMYSYKCPHDLVFNTVTEVCDHKTNVKECN